MILFYYGHTLLYEPDFNKLCGMEAIMPYVTENPQELIAKEIADFNGKIYSLAVVLERRKFLNY
jgi:hypothetical protein